MQALAFRLIFKTSEFFQVVDYIINAIKGDSAFDSSSGEVIIGEEDHVAPWESFLLQVCLVRFLA